MDNIGILLIYKDVKNNFERIRMFIDFLVSTYKKDFYICLFDVSEESEEEWVKSIDPAIKYMWKKSDRVFDRASIINDAYKHFESELSEFFIISNPDVILCKKFKNFLINEINENNCDLYRFAIKPGLSAPYFMHFNELDSIFGTTKYAMNKIGEFNSGDEIEHLYDKYNIQKAKSYARVIYNK